MSHDDIKMVKQIRTYIGGSYNSSYYVMNENNPNKLYKINCQQHGLKQIGGTCWFNSILNELLLGELSFTHLSEKYFDMPLHERILIEVTPISEKDAIIPFGEGNKSHFFRFVYEMMKPREKSIEADGARLIREFNIRPKWVDYVTDGYPPNLALQNLLSSILNKNDYMIINSNTIRIPTNIPSTVLYVYFSNTIINFFRFRSSINVDEIKLNNFKLDSVSICIRFNKGSHAICGYVCQNKYYIFDSNFTSSSYEIDWRNTENIIEFYKKLNMYRDSKLKEVYYLHLCFVRSTLDA